MLEIKPLMLKTTKGEFVNANKIYSMDKNGEIYYEGGPDSIDNANLTKESINLLTNSSAQPKSLDIDA